MIMNPMEIFVLGVPQGNQSKTTPNKNKLMQLFDRSFVKYNYPEYFIYHTSNPTRTYLSFDNKGCLSGFTWYSGNIKHNEAIGTVITIIIAITKNTGSSLFPTLINKYR